MGNGILKNNCIFIPKNITYNLHTGFAWYDTGHICFTQGAFRYKYLDHNHLAHNVWNDSKTLYWRTSNSAAVSESEIWILNFL